MEELVAVALYRTKQFWRLPMSCTVKTYHIHSKQTTTKDISFLVEDAGLKTCTTGLNLYILFEVLHEEAIQVLYVYIAITITITITFKITKLK